MLLRFLPSRVPHAEVLVRLAVDTQLLIQLSPSFLPMSLLLQTKLPIQRPTLPLLPETLHRKFQKLLKIQLLLKSLQGLTATIPTVFLIHPMRPRTGLPATSKAAARRHLGSSASTTPRANC